MISRFYTDTFTNTRMSFVNNRSTLVSVGSFKGHIQQARAELAEQLNSVWTRTFSLWCETDTDVQDGDVITYNGDTYNVKAIQLNNIGDNSHLEIIIEKDEN